MASLTCLLHPLIPRWKLFWCQTWTQGDHIVINVLDPTRRLGASGRLRRWGSRGGQRWAMIAGGRKCYGRRSEVEGRLGRRDQIRQWTAASHRVGLSWPGRVTPQGLGPSRCLPEVTADLLPAGGANERSTEDTSALLHPSSLPVAAPEKKRGGKRKSIVLWYRQMEFIFLHRFPSTFTP